MQTQAPKGQYRVIGLDPIGTLTSPSGPHWKDRSSLISPRACPSTVRKRSCLASDFFKWKSSLRPSGAPSSNRLFPLIATSASVLRKWDAGHVVFTDATAPLAEKGSVPPHILSRVCGVVVLPIEEKENNEDASAEHSIDR